MKYQQEYGELIGDVNIKRILIKLCYATHFWLTRAFEIKDRINLLASLAQNSCTPFLQGGHMAKEFSRWRTNDIKATLDLLRYRFPESNQKYTDEQE